MKRFAVLISGFGSNLQALIDAVKAGEIKAEIGLVISSNAQAQGLKRAEEAKIKTQIFDAKDYPDKQTLDRAMVEALEKEKIDFIVLAGYMRILTAFFIKKYRNKILNIHPALLPEFKGAHAIKDAYEAGVQETGVTVHFVEEKVDNGPIILREKVPIKPGESLKALEAKIHAVEHKLYPKAVSLFAQGRVKLNGRQVVIE